MKRPKIFNRPSRNTTPVLDHQRLIALINSMADAVLTVDETQKIIISNSAALNLLDTNNLNNIMLGDVLNLSNERGEKVDIAKLALSGKKGYASRELQLKYGDGSSIDVYFSSSPVYGGFGTKSDGGFVILIRDITQEKTLEEERNEFISVASHELRTPITIAEAGVSNALLLAQKNKLSDSITENLVSAHEQIVFLGNLINDLSMLSRAERGKFASDIEEINISELIEQFSNNYKHQAATRGLSFQTNVEPNLGSISTSRLYLQEILQNFITNALKYTDKGGISLNARRRDGLLELEVVDTGIGISKSEQEKLFSKFFRSEDFRVKKITGTGLGLYVSSKLAKLLGARIQMRSELNKGSIFRLVFPKT